ncbi:MAG: hypothetical protein JF586_05130 [Burkholderiales bacterium]|nr:hypothetical protein [Burkholderiales bacterium]
MNRTRSLLVLATAGLAAAALLRAVRHARYERRIAAAAMPDRSALEQPPAHHDELETYQVLLDESLYLTFPASDPVCAQAATRCGDPVTTPANPADWRLHRGSIEAGAAADR